MSLGWPGTPFPEIGRLILKFNMEKAQDGLEHAVDGSPKCRANEALNINRILKHDIPFY